jgi:predicted esterase
MRSLKFLAALALLVPAIPASAAEPVLHAKPAAASLTLKTGTSRLNDKTFVYVPRSVAGPAPVVLLLHGAGQRADDFLKQFTKEADKTGAILVVPQAASGSWTLKPDGAGGADFGADPAAIDAALSALFAKAPVDPAHVAVLGFSDGASYALSLGLSNPQLFKGIAALSPGTVWLPPAVDKTQRIYITHGRHDDMLPLANVRDNIVPGLQKAGLNVQVSWHGGEHEVDPRTMAQGFEYAIGK